MSGFLPTAPTQGKQPLRQDLLEEPCAPPDRRVHSQQGSEPPRGKRRQQVPVKLKSHYSGIRNAYPGCAIGINILTFVCKPITGVLPRIRATLCRTVNLICCLPFCQPNSGNPLLFIAQTESFWVVFLCMYILSQVPGFKMTEGKQNISVVIHIFGICETLTL